MRLRIASALTLCCVAGASFAADLPTRKSPPAPAPIEAAFSWTGFYLGGQIGGAWNTGAFDNSVDPLVGLYAFPGFSLDNSGLVGGAHAGYNYQIGQFVVGAEGEFDFVGVGGWETVSSYPFGQATIRTNQRELGAVNAKLGYAFGRILVSALGGVAFTKYSFADRETCTGVACPPGVTYSVSYPDSERTGWTVGASIDYALTNSWILGLDYRFYDFGSKAIFSGYPAHAAGPGLDGLRVRETENTLAASVGYKF